MIDAAEILTFLWGTVWGGISLKRLLQGDRNSILIVYLVFYGMYVVPLGLDLFSRVPTYQAQPGFAMAVQDSYVRVLYCVFVFIVPPLWLWKKKVLHSPGPTHPPAWVTTILFIGSILPVLLVLLSPEPQRYLEYAFFQREQVGLGALAFHTVVSIATVLSVLCSSFLVLLATRPRPLMIPPWATMLISAWINGKRYIVALAIGFTLLALWYRGTLAGKKLVCAGLAGGIVLGIFSFAYQSLVRDVSFQGTSGESAQEGVRIDYTRDSRVKMAMFAELYPDKMRILEYRGQSLLFNATLFVPRALWVNKPYPYAMYFTSAMLVRRPEPIGWGMTTGIFDETISNVGLIGVVIGPLLVLLFCRIGDSLNRWHVNVLTCVTGFLLLSVQVAAFWPLMLLWFVLVIKTWRAARRRVTIKVIVTRRAIQS